MPSVPHEFVTVEMRGLKGPLLGRARAERTSVSALVRAAVAARLYQCGRALAHGSADEVRSDEYTARLNVRLFAREARQFTDGAQRAGLSRGAYLVQLMQADAGSSTAGQRMAQIAAVVASNGHVSTLSRNIRHLATLLGQGSVRAAHEYRAMLDSLEGDVRRHLALVAQLASTLPRPRRGEELLNSAGARSGGSL